MINKVQVNTDRFGQAEVAFPWCRTDYKTVAAHYLICLDADKAIEKPEQMQLMVEFINLKSNVRWVGRWQGNSVQLCIIANFNFCMCFCAQSYMWTKNVLIIMSSMHWLKFLSFVFRYILFTSRGDLITYLDHIYLVFKVPISFLLRLDLCICIMNINMWCRDVC